MSLALCTARSARPSRTAACTSVTNTPRPDISEIGVLASVSPLVVTGTNSAADRSAPEASSACATARACQSANGLERVAILTLGRSPLEVEQVAYRVSEAVAFGLAGSGPQGDRWVMQQFVDK